MHFSRSFPSVRAALVLLLAVVLPQLAHADVPGRVGRIAFMSGDVQSYSETEPEWKAAYVNEPITSRNSLFAGEGARAEISIGATTLALDAGSQVDIQQLDDNTFNANVVRGRVSLRVRRIDQGDQYNVAVPGADIALLRPGRYRIDALESGSGVTVHEGQADVRGERTGATVDAGRALRIVAGQDPDGPVQLLSAAPTSASLDDWVLAREARFRNSQAERYVSPNMTGYEDLDANGRWSNEADVGPVWYPTTYVDADWAPYRHGRWAYVAPWGYTWVDDAPWGFAPFHYGRWLQVGGRWGWCPGEYVVRPAYAPALVGFYGGSGSAAFSVGVGPAVGWYPLAPWERFNPGYAHGPAYVNQVNNIRIVAAPPRFSTRGPGGWNRERGSTIAPQQAFASQRSITSVAIAAPRDFVERGGALNVNALPRPAAVPGASRRGPEPGYGVARPEFRSPRDFASRGPGEQRSDSVRSGGSATAVESPRGVPPPVNERGGPPPNYRRIDDGQRPGITTETARPSFNPGNPTPLERTTERGNLQQRMSPGFNREPRQESTPVAPGAPTGVEVPRYAPRGQPGARGAEDAVDGRGRAQFEDRSGERQNERSFERQRGDARPVQVAPPFQQPAAPVQPQPQMRPAPAFERPRPEVRAVPQPQPVQPPAPQPVQQPQRIEQRPAPAAAPQVPAPAAPAPVRRAEPGRPEPGERGGPLQRDR